MRTQHFAFGTRIHGNIAALQVGTPAHVLTFDSRTLELARYHEIPHTPLEDVAADLDVGDLYQRSDFRAFNSGHSKRTELYLRFLEANGLHHIFAGDAQPDDFDARLAQVSFPSAVMAISEGGDDFVHQVLSRLSWLRQGGAVDAKRDHNAYSPAFAPTRESLSLEKLLRRIRELELQVGDLDRMVSDLSPPLTDEEPSPEGSGLDVRRSRQAQHRLFRWADRVLKQR